MNSASSHFERYRLRILPLTPIHVGSGNSVEPFDYELIVKEQVGLLNVYDLNQLLSSLNDSQRAAFEQLSNSSFEELRIWLREQFHHEHFRYQIRVALEAAKELANSIDASKRSCEIEILPRSPFNENPYLPGSSVKGAIRTAILNGAVVHGDPGTQRQLRTYSNEVKAARQRNQQNRGEQRFQATALQYENDQSGPDLRRDPLRQLAIADFSWNDDRTYIDRIRIVKRDQPINESNSEKILMYRELCDSFLLYQNEDMCLESELRLYPQLADSRVWKDGINRQLSWDLIREACNEFYLPRFQDELQKHIKSPMIRERLTAMPELLQPDECLIRLGRHSHYECVTVSEPYNVEPRKGFGKSRSYVRGTIPLGWARLSVEKWS